jgi:hypothetical protein
MHGVGDGEEKTAKVQKSHQLSVLKERVFGEFECDGETTLILPCQLRGRDVHQILQNILILFRDLRTADLYTTPISHHKHKHWKGILKYECCTKRVFFEGRALLCMTSRTGLLGRMREVLNRAALPHLQSCMAQEITCSEWLSGSQKAKWGAYIHLWSGDLICSENPKPEFWDASGPTLLPVRVFQHHVFRSLHFPLDHLCPLGIDWCYITNANTRG